ncbi:hypothetical protein [Pendulispora albinea]|uniref:Lipoprotein n=1 Tax=Pendulispora albinea TaxID=2741071 RepID=A0ABZ2M1S2_9BACT
MMKLRIVLAGMMMGATCALFACSDDGVNPNPTPKPGPGTDGGGGISVGGFKAFSAPQDPGARGILFGASGEQYAQSGFAFPPNDFANDTYMVDGWELKLDSYLAVFDHVTLWDNPNQSPQDQSQHGGRIAHVDGPWVVDLHKNGDLIGKAGEPERAVSVVSITKKDDGSSFDPSATYAFGFSTVAAPSTRATVYNVNLDESQLADYDYMAQNGYSILYIGTATFKGANCTSTTTAGGGTYDYSNWPKTIRFKLGFSTPTNYVNCQNGTDLQGEGIGGEEHPRGVQVKASGSVQAQVTLHMDHPFWESFAEDSRLHFDPIAAQFAGVTGTPEAHIEDLRKVNFQALTDKAGKPLPWRNCAGTNYAPPGKGQMFLDPLSVPVDPAASDASKALRDYYDYIRYTQATQGHLNSQGLCFVDRQHPSPAK